MASDRELAGASPLGLNPGVEECWMDLDGARMRYLRAGSGPALILLHGLLGYSFSWRYTMPALAPYATVYAPDMLGAGSRIARPGLITPCVGRRGAFCGSSSGWEFLRLISSGLRTAERSR
jgi:pimeloyl-ACP methyl ester carboxylesterase